MYQGRLRAVTRWLTILLAGAILLAPVVSIAHSIEHHGTIDSADCGTCHWSKSAIGTLADSPSVGFFAVAKALAAAVAPEPWLCPALSSIHSRGPPSRLI